MTCKECGGDVVRLFVGPTPVYRHAVPGIDHGPLPTPQSEADRTPSVRPPSRQPGSRLARSNPVGYSAAD